jgi:hypothetical protein
VTGLVPFAWICQMRCRIFRTTTARQHKNFPVLDVRFQRKFFFLFLALIARARRCEFENRSIAMGEFLCASYLPY